MNQQELVAKLRNWKFEFTHGVGRHFVAGHSERGMLALHRWRDDFGRFLKEHVPAEVKRFKAVHDRCFVRLVQTDDSDGYADFMQDYGNNYLAFLENLEQAAQKGRLPKATPPAPRKVRTTPAYVDPTRISELKSLSPANLILQS